MNDLIGFFDSGVGGVSVLHTARRILPNEHFLYYGDNGHAPYGPKPLEDASLWPPVLAAHEEVLAAVREL